MAKQEQLKSIWAGVTLTKKTNVIGNKCKNHLTENMLHSVQYTLVFKLKFKTVMDVKSPSMLHTDYL